VVYFDEMIAKFLNPPRFALCKVPVGVSLVAPQPCPKLSSVKFWAMEMKISWQLIDFHHRIGRFKAVRKVLLNDLHRKLRREFFRIPPGGLR
jgi:hypothetical protein